MPAIVRYNVRMKLKSKGFTLVELLITIAIIGLIMAIVIAGLELIRQKGRDAARIADIKQINGAIENFFDSCNYFPEDIYADAGGLVPDCNGNVYLPEVPTDPKSGEEYPYYFSETPFGFHLCAKLELPGPAKGKAGSPSLAQADLCRGDDQSYFDVLGGALK